MRNQRIKWAVAAVAVALMLWWLWPRGSDSEGDATRAQGGDPADRGAKQRPSLDRPVPRALRRVPPEKQGGPAEKPIIDSVTLEKDAVCAGEEYKVSVVAHTPGNRDDAYLRYVVGGLPGPEVILRTKQRDADATTDVQRKVIVLGRSNVMITAPLPQPKLKDCSEARAVNILHRGVRNTLDEVEFFAKVRNITAKKPMAMPLSYRWDFGDGTKAVTSSPITTHNYEGRSFKTAMSHFMVQVVITDKKGETLVGRKGLALHNDSFEQFTKKGLIYVRSLMTPRFPVMNDSGIVVQKVRLSHKHDKPVTITWIERGYHPSGGKTPPPARRVDPAKVLGKLVIPPGESVVAELAFDTNDHPDMFAVRYSLRGVSSDGWPAFGAFSLMRPVEKPTRDRHNPVTDPLLAAKILRARELLNKKFVTAEEIYRLEREGKFQGLEPVKNLQVLQPEPPPPKGKTPDDDMSYPGR